MSSSPPNILLLMADQLTASALAPWWFKVTSRPRTQATRYTKGIN
jgi:hypothetical protein